MVCELNRFELWYFILVIQLCGQYMCTPRLSILAKALNEDPRTTDRGSSASLGFGLA